MENLKKDNSEKYVFELFREALTSRNITGESLFRICDVKA